MPVKKPTEKLYDPECAELAQHFLAHYPQRITDERVASLARSIQQAVEDWFEDHPITETLKESAR